MFLCTFIYVCLREGLIEPILGWDPSGWGYSTSRLRIDLDPCGIRPCAHWALSGIQIRRPSEPDQKTAGYRSKGRVPEVAEIRQRGV